MLLFGTEQQLTFLFSAKHIMMDGTFDVCPPYFDQVYTIHAIKHEKGMKSIPKYMSVLCIFKKFLQHIHVSSVYYATVNLVLTGN